MPRDLTVRVRADVGAYQKAMSAAASSTDQFAQAGLRLQKVGMSISNLGDSLTKSVTLPLGLAGAAAIKMASDFDRSFVQMQTLAGVSAGQVGKLKESVLDLAGETGRAPQELADALYFLSSAGLDSSQAMEALEASAKASAIGLGSTEVVADAVSSAMLAYAKAGLTAAEATDTLVATARAGKVEPSELASQLGRILPVASALGIEFQDVGGAIAVLSRGGNDASTSVTQLGAVMAKLLKPSQQAIDLLDGVGISLDDLHAMVAEQGILASLIELREVLGNNGFNKFLEDQQAIIGATAILNGDMKETEQVFKDVAESAGTTENAFSTWAESMGAQNAQAFAEFQVALIRIGEVLAPIASDVLNFVSKIAEAFSDLPEGVQQAVIAFGILAAALGPLLSVGGRLITAFGTALRLIEGFALPAGTVANAFNGTTVAAGGLSSALGAAGVAGALLAVSAGFALFLRSKNDARIAEAATEFAELENVTRSTAAAVLDLNDAVSVSTTDFTTGSSAATEFAESGKITADVMRDLDDRFSAVLDKAPHLAQGFIDNAREIGVSREKLAEWQSQLEDKIGTDAEAKGAQEEYNAAVNEAAGVTEEATSALQAYREELAAQFDPIYAAVSSSRQLAEANTAVAEAEAAVTTAIAEHGEGSAEAVAAQDALTQAYYDASKAALDQEIALAGLVDMVRQQPGAVDAAKAKLSEWVAQGWITQATADATAAKFDEVTASANSIPAAKNTHVSVTGAEQSINDIRAIQASINALHGRDVGIRIVGTAVGAVGGGVMRFHEGGVVPGRRGEEIAAVLQAGERVQSLAEVDAMNRPRPWVGGTMGPTSMVMHITGNGALFNQIAKGIRTGEVYLVDGNGQRVRAA